MPYVALAITALIVIQVWSWMANRRPVKYRRVSLAGLEDHLDQVLRRAFRSAELHIEDERTGKALLIRKWYEWQQVGYDAYLIFQEFTRHSPAAEEFRAELRQKHKKCDYGIARPAKYKNVLACKCKGELDEVLSLTRLALSKLYRVPADATFTVFVMGPVENADIMCDGRTSMRLSLGLTLSGNWGRPYLKSQAPGGMFHWVGWMIGRLVSSVERVFFPRNPEDDLKK